LLRDEVTPAFFRDERLRAVAGIIAPAVPVLIGLASPPLALHTMVAMPVFYAITAEGLRGPSAAAPPTDPQAVYQPAPRRSRGIFRR
jgi:hypothetical protein